MKRLLLIALALAAPANAQFRPGDPVLDTNPYPTKDSPFTGVEAFVAGATVTPRRAIAIVCTASGNVQVRLTDDSTITVPVNVGFSLLGLAVKGVVAGGTTATCTYGNLK